MTTAPEWEAGKAATHQDVENCVASSKGAPASCSMCGGVDLRLQTSEGDAMPFTMGGGNSQRFPPDEGRRHYLLLTCNNCGHLHWFDASIIGNYLLSR